MGLFELHQFSLELGNIQINLTNSALMQGVEVVNVICIGLLLFDKYCSRLFFFDKFFGADIRLVNDALAILV